MIAGDPALVETGAGELRRAADGFDASAAAVRAHEREARGARSGSAAVAVSERLDELARATVVGAVVCEEVEPILRRHAADLRSAANAYTAAQDRLRTVATLAGPGGPSDAALASGPAAGAPAEMTAAAEAAARANVVAAHAVRVVAASRLGAMQTSAPAAVPPPSPPPPPVPGEGSGRYAARDATAEDHVRMAIARAGSAAFEAMGRVNAARHLNHFLAGTGEPLVVDPQLIARDDPRFRRAADNQAERTVRSIVDEASRSGRFDHTIPFDTGWAGYQFRQDAQPDWFYAVGGMSYATTGQIVVHPPVREGQEPVVEVEQRLHVFDRYNWDGTKSTDVLGVRVSDTALQELHRAGLAREFDTVGAGARHTIVGPLSGASFDPEPAPAGGQTRTDPGRSRW